ncbi:hypothetical protein GWI33_001123 [Rhynchophorus ferrugineus]|uniref:Uncharacterized protein n=1 Tax=Rhynchophorus ferrugineus TaxID=354439 RepID=A0A834ISW6_RHYFE|nr:hypothetical protein GWI33_001123 [Rhynchophorus ferrugineus]
MDKKEFRRKPRLKKGRLREKLNKKIGEKNSGRNMTWSAAHGDGGSLELGRRGGTVTRLYSRCPFMEITVIYFGDKIVIESV